MKTKKGFTLREIGVNQVLVPESIEVINFNKLVSINSSAKYLWENLQGRDFSAEDMVNLLTAKYNVSEDTALADAERLIEDWKRIGLLEE
ncbi:MAG: PqqD family protein [Bacteroidaceae bacterium]|nr:PqqD family protein [Bacteroidaceae bacterium]